MKGEHRRHDFFRDAVRQFAGFEALADEGHMFDHAEYMPAVVVLPLPSFFRGKLELAPLDLDGIQVGAGQERPAPKGPRRLDALDTLRIRPPPLLGRVPSYHVSAPLVVRLPDTVQQLNKKY